MATGAASSVAWENESTKKVIGETCGLLAPQSNGVGWPALQPQSILTEKRNTDRSRPVRRIIKRKRSPIPARRRPFTLKVRVRNIARRREPYEIR
jgi:hypothetical protein